jgi:hypothetical protein
VKEKTGKGAGDVMDGPIRHAVTDARSSLIAALEAEN